MQELPPHLLGTNHIPSPEESTLIRQSLIPLHHERALALDAQVERAQAALESLQLEQQVQRSLLLAHKALLTPMRRLIPDMLLEIFRHCHSDMRDAPMRLARVCRKWREVVLSAPMLWTVVTLHGAIPTVRIVPFARACAERSGACAIKVAVSFMNRRHDTEKVRRALFEALGILARHVDRWQTFEMLVHKAYRPDDGEIRFPAAAPRLEKMVMVCDVAMRIPFLYLPNLRDLRLYILHPKDVPTLLRCTTLRYLNVGGPSGELTLMNCWTIFSNCPLIEKFDVMGIKPDLDVSPKDTVTLSRLHELRLGPFTPDPAPLMHCIKAPALQRLRLLVGKSMEFDSTCITRLVHEYRPPLTSLSLVNTNGADVAACLPFLPDLISLTLQQASAPDLVIRRLLEQDAAGRFHCPELMHLGLRLCLFSGAWLVEFARARRAAAGGLRVLNGDNARHRQGGFEGLTIELNLVGEFSDDELDELVALQTTEDELDELVALQTTDNASNEMDDLSDEMETQ